MNWTVGLFCVKMEAVGYPPFLAVLPIARNQNRMRPAFEVGSKQLSSPIKFDFFGTLGTEAIHLIN